MIVIKFYEDIEPSRLTYAVIAARHGGNWIFCKHRGRESYELPGGHIENTESACEAAMRELKEETGALDFDIRPVCVYSANEFDECGREIGTETFGMVYMADVRSFAPLEYEIESIIFSDGEDIVWTYPHIHPKILEEVKRRAPHLVALSK